MSFAQERQTYHVAAGMEAEDFWHASSAQHEGNATGMRHVGVRSNALRVSACGRFYPISHTCIGTLYCTVEQPILPTREMVIKRPHSPFPDCDNTVNSGPILRGSPQFCTERRNNCRTPSMQRAHRDPQWHSLKNVLSAPSQIGSVG
jgi:hypothetical protein